MKLRSWACLLSSIVLISGFFSLNVSHSSQASLFAPALTAVYREDETSEPERRLKAITRTALKQLPLDYGDPSPPQINCEGDLVVTTTGGFQLRWSRDTPELAWRAFLRGERPVLETIAFHHDLNSPLKDELGEDVWDPMAYCFQNEEYVIGSLMARTQGKSNAVWPDDHWSRRTYLFRNVQGAWIPDQRPLFAPEPRDFKWEFHNYGHGMLLDETGRGRIFYERVTEERRGLPFKTEIFSQGISDFLKADGNEQIILEISKEMMKSARRNDGAYLLEGPRPFAFNDQVGISFSAGDYNSDDYGIHLMWETEDGNFEPVIDRKGRLADFGRNIREYLPMTWGPGRAAFFEYDDQWWVIFHGVPVGSPFDIEEARRDLFLAPVRIHEGRIPRVEILVRD